MAKILILSITLLTLASCGSLPFLGGGGPNVAANTQVGAENNQGVTTNIDNTTSIRPVLRPEGPVEEIVQDNSTTNNTEIDPFLLLLLVLGWLLPSPAEMGRGLQRMLSTIFVKNK